MSRRILIVEDDATTRDFVSKALREAGMVIEAAETGREGLYHATAGEHDLIILDRMLPELDGLSLLKSVRAAGFTTPVLMLTALDAVDERVRGLRAGADDYLAKPFSIEELLARVEVLMRRPQATAEDDAETVLQCSDLHLDLISRTAQRGEQVIELLPREFQMLEFLMRRQGRVVTRTMMLEGLWDYHFDPQTNVIDVHISRLRRKIDDPFETPLIRTVRGAGYVLGARP